ncbi:MAG: hypothetical protein NC417_11210 [Candidatus Gastranaerophilales bacterium]|nr:hypothetical protein [Candidatus Gastranaerophilales bacterium]
MAKRRLMAFALSLCMILAPMQASATVSDGDAINAGQAVISDDAVNAEQNVIGDDAVDAGPTVTDGDAAAMSNEELGGVPQSTSEAGEETGDKSLETVYLYEDFEDATNYAVGTVILEATTADVGPLTIGQIAYKSGSRNGSLHNKVTAVETGGSTGIEISESRFTSSNRGVSLTFSGVPTVDALAEGEVLEFSMDFSSNATFTLAGYGDIALTAQTPESGMGHLSVVLDPTAGTKKVTITDAEGTVLDIKTEEIGTTTGFTGLGFYTENTTALIDNIKIVKKADSVTYLYEDFEDTTNYAVGTVILEATTADVGPLTIGQIAYKSGSRNGSLHNKVTAVETGGSTGIEISESRFTSSNRGVSLTFSGVPTVDALAEGEVLEFSMDFSSNATFTLAGYGDIALTAQTPESGMGHLSVVLDPTAGTKKVTITDAEGTVLDIKTEEIGTTTGFTGLGFYTENTTALIDNIKIVKKAADSGSEERIDIFEIDKMPEVEVTSDSIADYVHPLKTTVKLSDGNSIEVDIDSNSWSSEPAFDETVTNLYTWTANIIAPEDHANPKGLKASYDMAYTVLTESTHDYENNFMFDKDYSGFAAWGKDMDKDSGSGGFTLSIGVDSGNVRYLNANADGNGDRGSRLTISSEIVKGAEVTFDWMPIDSNGKGNAQLMFLAPGQSHPYFGLRADTGYNLSYFTENPLKACSTTQNPFEGSVVAGAAEGSTGLSGQNKWFTVNIKFDYITHTATLSITEAGTDNTFVKTDIPIEKEANGLECFVIHMNKLDSGANVTQGINKLTVDYAKFDGQDIVDVVQPSDVITSMAEIEDFDWPKEVTVVLGDGSRVSIPVGEWTAEPAFDLDTEAVYAWSAPLVTGEYTNYFKLQAAFEMDYTLLPYVVNVNNPPTLELEPGDDWSADELPETVTAILSNGQIIEAAVKEWVPIRSFDAGQEGVYVYGAMLAQGSDYAVVTDRFLPNEYHGDAFGTAQVSLEQFNASLATSLRSLWNYAEGQFLYHVFYRISCYDKADGYNSLERSMERLDRGVTAIPSGDGILVSWRVLVDEYGTGIQFNVLRNGEVIASGISTKSNYLDANGNPGDVYSVQVVKDGAVTETASATALEQAYLSIAVQNPGSLPDRDGNLQTYSINDAGVADVDGDGEYEIVVKWYPSDAFDSGKQDGPSAPTLFDFYEMDGTALWRLNMGLEMPSGAHFNQFIFYDLDEDGKAEFFIKTSDGTVSYRPNDGGLFDMSDASTEVSYIGDRSVKPGANINNSGHANVNSHEFVSVFNGATGEEIATVNYENTVTNFDDYGDNWGNRASRFNIAIAYQPKKGGSGETYPTVLFNRGYYAKTTVAAYQLIDGELVLAWNYDTPSGSEWAGKGNHNISTGDMDNDGYDELVIGALAFDHDGTVLWVKNGVDGQDYQGHSDSIHLAAMNPENPTQLYVFTPSEEKESTLNGTLSNASNGSRINGMWRELADIGRGVAANITPAPGFEYWINTPNNEGAPTGGIYNFFGDVVAVAPPANMSTNWRLYWDGDLLSELGDGYNSGASGTAQTIYKYDWENNELNTMQVLEGTHTNNGTKNNPSLTADIFGDWREEVMVGNADNTELRIYMTPYETDYMIYSLMQDPVYRNAVANQNTAYNQPPHLGFYLGEDNKEQVLDMRLPKPGVRYTTSYRTEVEKDEEAVEKSLEEAVAIKSVKEKTGCSTAEALRQYLTQKVTDAVTDYLSKKYDEEDVSVEMFEVQVRIIDESGYVQTATAKNFPENGVDVVIPYPEGTSMADEFVITHLVTINCNGKTAGDTESFSSENSSQADGAITKTADGLQIHVMSASPFVVGWKVKAGEANTPSGDDDSDSGDDAQAADGTGAKQGGTPKTGDQMGASAMSWSVILVAAIGGVVAVFMNKRKKDAADVN